MLGATEHGVQYALHEATILLIDDDPDTVAKISEYLAHGGFQLMVARSGAEGIAQARHARPDLILLALQLPDLDGRAICRRLTTDKPTRNIPLILLAIPAEVEVMAQDTQGDAANYIAKPVQRAELLDHIIKQLQARRVHEQIETLRSVNAALQRQVDEQSAALAQANAQLQEQIRERKQVEERLRQYVRRVVDAQEAERDHIARELHDEIGQALALLKVNVRTVQRLTHESDLAPRLAQSLTMIEETLQRVRAMALDLRPSMLNDLGLVTTLRWYVERHSRWAGLDAEVVVEAFESRIPTQLETVCFRVAQEALSNIARHAQARSVHIRLWQRDSAVHMLIRDDGIGFDVLSAQERAMDGASIGLLGMEDRVLLVGGQLVIESAPGRGATVWLRLPLSKDTSAALLGGL